MKVRLAYGQSGLDIDVDPNAATVVEPVHHEAAADQSAVLRAALRDPVAGPPLRERVRPGQTVAISACDGTRPQPRHLMIPAVLDELDGIVRLEDVVILVATGTHRGNSEAELRAMFGDEVVDTVRIVNHDARDAGQLTWMGTYGKGVPVWLNREWTEADVRITTGFVEPHFFAGFSGGPKLVAPGLAALETVLVLHDAARIGDPRATWGVIHGNPVHDDIRAVVAAVGGVHFGFDVTLNRDQQIVGAFAGELFATEALRRGVAGIVIDGRCHVGLNLVGGEWGHNPLPWPNADELPGPPWADGYEFAVSTEYPTGAPPRPAVVAPGPIEEVQAKVASRLRCLA